MYNFQKFSVIICIITVNDISVIKVIYLFSSNFFKFFPVPDLSFTRVHVPLTDSVWKGLDDSQRCLGANQNETLIQDIRHKSSINVTECSP